MPTVSPSTKPAPHPHPHPAGSPQIIVRKPPLDYTDVPRAWMAGSTAATAITNGVNLLFPPGERFFVRSVNHFLDQITDDRLRAEIKGFFGQEGRHSRAQGYEIDGFIERFEQICFGWLEARFSPELRLATTAAAEHFTAIMAEGAFTEGLLDNAHPAMQRLLGWHAAEEIEHRAVAFDVLQQVDPSYRTRVLGLAFATAILGGFWFAATATLLRQDGVSWPAALRQLRALRQRREAPRGKAQSIARRVFARGIREYLRRDFHPLDKPLDALAAAWFAAHDLAMPEAA
jgi:predicted metal-dependent hydrolase